MVLVLLVGISLTGPWNALNFRKFRPLDAETLVARQKKLSPMQRHQVDSSSKTLFCCFLSDTLLHLCFVSADNSTFCESYGIVECTHTLFAWYTVLQSHRRSDPFNCAIIMSDHVTLGTRCILYFADRFLLILCCLPKFGPPMLQFITQIILETLEAVIK